MSHMSRRSGKPTPDPATPSEGSVAVLGAGQMGLVCASILAGREGRGGEVTLWGREGEEIDRLLQTRRSPRLSGFTLPAGVKVTSELGKAVEGASVIVSAVPVQHIREVWTKARPAVPPRAGVVSVAKGIEISTLKRPTQIVAHVLRDDPDAAPRGLGCLSGPTIATELARCMPAAMVAASDDPRFALTIQRLFTTNWLRVYTQTDLIGVELAGAVKNVVAIAAGIIDGLQAGNNAKSALLARGLAEITRLGLAIGASAKTFSGIAGIGDLATSCFSPEGRNRSCGEALGRGVPLEEYLAKTPFVVEGVETARAVVALAAKCKVEMPIATAVHDVLFEELDPIEAIGSLMTRQPKAEHSPE